MILQKGKVLFPKREPEKPGGHKRKKKRRNYKMQKIGSVSGTVGGKERKRDTGA